MSWSAVRRAVDGPQAARQPDAARKPAVRPAGGPRGLVGLLLLASLLPAPGCQGRRWRPPWMRGEQEQEAQEQTPERPPIESLPPQTLPDDGRLSIHLVKPGHWTAAVYPLQANDQNYDAWLEVAAAGPDMTPFPIPGVPYRLTVARPAPLAAGQPTRIETMALIPEAEERRGQNPRLRARLSLARPGGRLLYETADLTTAMPGWQYFLVVLAQDPDAYAMLESLHSVRPPGDELSSLGPIAYYRVIRPRPDGPAPLPANPLAWTSIAYVLWDEASPDRLTAAQQDALIDWLHWGGQLIISGPNSLELLRGSFLADYLPAEASGAWTMRAEDLASWREAWTPPGAAPANRRPLAVPPDRGLLGVRLRLTPGSRFPPGAEQVAAERRVGRGRVVATAFSLTDPFITRWPHFDNFFNGCLLRRPRRAYRRTPNGETTLVWADWPGGRRDPRLVCGLRWFVRDAAASESSAGGGAGAGTESTGNPAGPAVRLAGWRTSRESGVGGWSDQGGVADRVRSSLRQAAGISVPRASFVLAVLLGYLAVLAPLNWTVFRLLGRVEWAWAAAPLIAVGGAVVVVRLAQLDIGFVRSQTELNVVEAHAGHRRAHCARFLALYTSLSTSYELTWDDPTAVARPFPSNPAAGGGGGFGEAAIDVLLRRTGRSVLSGFAVRSSMTRMVRAEQMLDLGGPLRLDRRPGRLPQLENATRWDFRDAAVLRRGPQGLEAAWIGRLPAGAAAALPFERLPPDARGPAQWEASPAIGGAAEAGRLDLAPLFALAAAQPLGPGELRLAAWTDQPLGGLDVRPRATQVVRRTFLVAQLAPAKLPPPQSDLNTRADVEENEARTRGLLDGDGVRTDRGGAEP